MRLFLEDEKLMATKEEREVEFWNYMQMWSKNRRYGRSDPPEQDGYGKLFHRLISPVSTLELAKKWSRLSAQPEVAEFKGTLETLGVNEETDECREYALVAGTPVELWSGQFHPDLLHIGGGSVLASIDIDAPEELLVKHLREFLRDYRALLKIDSIKKTFSRKDFLSWADKKVLLYIDLTLMAAAHNTRISHQAVGVMMFPDEYGVALNERIRNTIKPLCERLQRPEVIAAIRRQASDPHIAQHPVA